MHDKIKRLLTVAIVAVIGAFGGLAVASPAMASYSDCAAYSGVVCFHQYPDFTGQVWRQTTGQFPTGCRDLTYANFDNKASTAFNLTTDYIMRVYQGYGCTGSYVGLSPGDFESFGQTNTWFNNTASSVKLTYVG